MWQRRRRRANDVHVRRPESIANAVRVGASGEVICERIEPHVPDARSWRRLSPGSNERNRHRGRHGAVVASGFTHITCLASSGTGIPQSNVVREMERSSSGSRCNRARISLRHGSGLMNSGLLLMCSISRS